MNERRLTVLCKLKGQPWRPLFENVTDSAIQGLMRGLANGGSRMDETHDVGYIAVPSDMVSKYAGRLQPNLTLSTTNRKLAFRRAIQRRYL